MQADPRPSNTYWRYTDTIHFILKGEHDLGKYVVLVKKFIFLSF